MIEFELDIPSLTENGIQLRNSFSNVKEMICSSMILKMDNEWDIDSLDRFIRQKSEYLWIWGSTEVFINNW